MLYGCCDEGVNTMTRSGQEARDEGATAVEYAVLASLIAAVVAVTVSQLGQAILGLFNQAAAMFTPPS